MSDKSHNKHPGDKQRAHGSERRPNNVEQKSERQEKQRSHRFKQAPPQA